MKLRNLILITAFSLIILLSVNLCVSAEETELKEITVAVSADFEPFEYIDGSGNLTGIDIDIMNELCAIMEVKPTYLKMQFDEMIPTVRSPLADCAISAVTVTEHRAKVVDFTDSYIACRVYNPNLDKWYEEHYAIPVKLTGEYKEELNIAIATLKETGKIDEIAAKYGLTKDSEGFFVHEMPEIEAPSTDVYTVSGWAKGSVSNAINKHWTSPSDFENDYTANITREQFCEIVYNMLRDASGVDSVNLADVSFTDTKNTKVLYLAQEGIINGKGEGIFAPDDNLTREEAATILYRISRYSGLSIPEYNGSLFADDAEIADWSKPYVYSMLSANIMSGTDTGFLPKGTYTAEQAVATVERLYNSLD